MQSLRFWWAQDSFTRNFPGPAQQRPREPCSARPGDGPYCYPRAVVFEPGPNHGTVPNRKFGTRHYLRSGLPRYWCGHLEQVPEPVAGQIQAQELIRALPPPCPLAKLAAVPVPVRNPQAEQPSCDPADQLVATGEGPSPVSMLVTRIVGDQSPLPHLRSTGLVEVSGAEGAGSTSLGRLQRKTMIGS
jgi:hypothetical protein